MKPYALICDLSLKQLIFYLKLNTSPQFSAKIIKLTLIIIKFKNLSLSLK